MALKFYLNKFVKADNIEYYTLSQLNALRDTYQNYIEETGGFDPDFPMSNFGGDKGKKIGGTNIHTVGNETTFSKNVEDTDNNTPLENNSKGNKNLSVNERAINFLKNVGLKI